VNGHGLAPAASVAPRLVDIEGAAKYLGISYWVARDYIASGKIQTVTLPGMKPREGERPKRSLRRILIDIRDLDKFVDDAKASATL